MSSFSIDTYELDGVVVMDMKGRMDSVGNASVLLRQRVSQALAADRFFVFNFEDVGHIDSMGLGALIEAYTAIRERQGDVVLANLTKRSLELIVITKLTCAYKIFPSVQEAIASLRHARVQS